MLCAFSQSSALCILVIASRALSQKKRAYAYRIQESIWTKNDQRTSKA